MLDSNLRYRDLLDDIPVALWELDVTALVAQCQRLRTDLDAHDLHAYFTEHPDAARALPGSIEVRSVSRHAVELFESTSKDELMGSLERCFEPDVYRLFIKELIPAVGRVHRVRSETVCHTLGGKRFPVVLSQCLRHEPDGRARLLLTVMDSSERTSMERELRQAHAMLVQSRQEFEQFSYVVSHDLQEPLRMIASYTQLLERRYSQLFDDRARKFMHYITDGAKRMQMLLGDMLELARVGSRGNELEPVELDQVFHSVCAGMQTRIGSNDATVTADALPAVMGDAKQLAQVLHNLISNSIKFRSQTPPRVHVRARRDGPSWVVSVTDNGIGIEPKYHQAVFVIFRRLHGRSEFPGTGTGLTIAKKIIERHQGRIWAESHLGKGATFHFTLQPEPSCA